VEYEALDISGVCNLDVGSLGRGNELATGDHTFRGLPFRIGKSTDGEPWVLGFGEGICTWDVEIPVERKARHLVFAHFLSESALHGGVPFGNVAARYVFRFVEHGDVEVPIREAFEIGALPTSWFDFPILAWSDLDERMLPRREGAWIDFGMRQMEVAIPHPVSFYLWPWENPYPEDLISSVMVRPAGARFVLGGITAGYLDEPVFNVAAKRIVRIDLLKDDDASQPFSLKVDVDRGSSNYVWSLPAQSVEEFLGDSFRGWGQPENELSSPAYVDVAAKQSATITVSLGADDVGSFVWKELEERGTIDASDRVRVSIIDPGRNWVRTTVLDDETGRPLPCRIHFRSPMGVPFQPAGHQQHVVQALGEPRVPGWWAQDLDLGGDVRLGQVSYAYIDGTCEGWLPRGEVLVDVARGFEYEPIRARLVIEPGQQELTLRLRQIANMNEERYFSGDTHVHGLSTEGAHLEAAGEGLNVVNLLILQLGHLFAGTEEFVGGPSVSNGGETIVYAGQEPRQHVLGHISVLGIKRLLAPWATGGPDEGELGGNLETTMSRWADECHVQGGTAIVSHMPLPLGEFATLIATERVDAVEWIVHDPLQTGAYYRALNLGYPLPLVGGTDKISADIPVGIYRTYVHIPNDEPFTFDTWCAGLRAGNTFMTGGPLLRATVDGHPIGSTIELPGNGGEIEVEAWAESTLPFESLEVVVNGEVVAGREKPSGVRKISLHEKVKLDHHSWIAVRCGGAPYFESASHHDFYRRRILAHTSPFYVAVGGPWSMFDPEIAREFKAIVGGGIDYIRGRTLQWRPGSVTHHHGRSDHLAYLEEPFHEAIRRLEERTRKET
jgi:hypothetical protein